MSRRLLITLLTAAAGCSNAPGSLDVGSREAALQQLACPGGVESTGPNQCMTVPPVNKPAPAPNPVWDPFVTDGVRTKTEYFGAIDFPYVHPGLKLSGGHVFVNIEQNLKTLHVFVQNAPGLLKGEIRVYIDNGRFKTSADGDTTFNEPTSEDRAYAIDLTTGAKRLLRPVKTNGVINWQPLLQLCLPGWPCNPETFEGVLGAVSAPDANGVVRFNAEYTITLPSPLTNVPNGGPPGVGFGVAQWATPVFGSAGAIGPGVGAFPEELAISGTVLVQNGNTQVPEEVPAANVIDTRRNLFQTLVFGPPAGTPLKMMTWNIKRFTSFMHFVEGLGNAGAFDDSQVPPQLIGQFIAPMDVVALQEAWDDDDLTKILDAANAARAASNQPPFFKIGPIDFPKGQGISFDSTTGGVYILSKFPATEIDFKIYDACRGEDCLKAKGVLHARLNFSTTDVGGTANAAGRPLPGQKPDDFVDVYATHMQADELVCTSDAIETAVHNEVAIGLACSAIDPFFFAACLIADELLAGFHCDDFPDDQTVRDKQMDQMNAFIASTADRTRPAIVMGDFNTDTRNLNNDGTGHYGKILQQLHIGNVGSDPNDKAPDDRLNPWPIGFGFPWQVDHSDVGRETFSDSFWIDFGRGTDIGATDPDDPPPGSMVQTKLQRLDHVILRPGAQPGSSAFGNVTWMAGKPTNGSAVWASPWPLAASPINTVGNRMSDHKPVVFSFQMVPFKPAPKFHPGWNHSVRFRVKDANDQGDDDCFLCGAVDLYAKVKKRVVTVNSNVNASVFQGATCEEGGTSVFAGMPCVNSWSFTQQHDPTVNAVIGGGAQLWEEDDDPNSDDLLDTMWGPTTGGLYSVNFPAQRIELRDLETATTKPCLNSTCTKIWNDLTITDNGAYGFCTRTESPSFCVELRIDEIAP